MNRRVLIPEPDYNLPPFNTSTGVLQWIGSIDHKQIGIMYLLMALLFFLMGGFEAMMIRLQLAQPGQHILGPHAYNEFFTMHGTTMIFLVLMPILIGLGTYLIPMMIGANEMAFPRLNALSFWVTLFGGVLLYWSFFAGGAPDAGWFSYAPISEKPFSATSGSSYYALSLLLMGIGSVGAALNFVVTTIWYRAPGMSWGKLPLFVWMWLINSFLLLAAFPPLNAGLAMLLIDRILHGHFFLGGAIGGSSLLWQHIFWVFGHPEVYILILPAFGVISEVIPVFSRKVIAGYWFVAGSTIAIALLAFGVWVHHMFATGLGNIFNGFFMATSLMIGVPTGIKFFSWTLTMYKGSIRYTVAMWFAIAFLGDFVVGGLSGIAFALVPIDWMLTDTYFVVAHLHYVFVGGTLFAGWAGIYYWFPKMTGRMLSEFWGKIHFWLFIIGFNMTFMIQHLLGLMGMPRRVYTYPNLPWFGTFNAISTAGAFLMLFGVFAFLWNIYSSMRKPHDAGADPWDAWTLEWLCSSPPQPKTFTKIPPVHSARPLWDIKHPENPDYDPSVVNGDGVDAELVGGQAFAREQIRTGGEAS
jgi:cytochrome c oxidase subunit 1/cytochrome c oxidase subunit I+III